MAVIHHKRGARNGYADGAFVKGIAHGLMAATEERVGRAAHSQTAFFSLLQYSFPFGGVQCKRFFAIGVFAGLQGSDVDVRVCTWNGQVENDFDVVSGQ